VLAHGRRHKSASAGARRQQAANKCLALGRRRISQIYVISTLCGRMPAHVRRITKPGAQSMHSSVTTTHDDMVIQPHRALDEREQLSPTAAQPVKTGVSRCRVTRAEQATGKVSVTIEPGALCAIFGVADPDVATRLLSQLVGVLQPDPAKPVDAAVVNQALAMIEGIGPTDTLEAMTATLLVCVQHAAHDSMRRALHPDQTPGGRAIYGALALKTMRTYAQLLEAHNHGRGKGVTQQIIVKRITVEPGAQTVVGSVELNRGRG
jgi:hypothetical protein